MGKYEEAIATCSSALGLRPDLVEALNDRGNAFALLGQHSRAIDDYDAALRLRPTLSYVYNNRGNARAALGELDGAIVDYDAALRLEADYAEAYANRGNAELQKGEYQRAVSDLDVALRIKPDYARARENRERAIQLSALVNASPTIMPVPFSAQAPIAPDKSPHPGVLPRAEPEKTLAEPEPLPFPPGASLAIGSGIVLEGGREIITNRHVIDGVHLVVVRNGSGYVRKAHVAAMSSKDDLALLQIESPFPGGAGMALSALQDPPAGRQIVVMGFPLTDILGDDRPSMTEGIVSKAAGFGNDPTTFQITAKINAGNSGGPVFDDHGRLMGVVVAKMPIPSSQPPRDISVEDVNLAIKASRILDFLGRETVSAVRPELDNSSPEDLYRQTLSSVVLVAGEKDANTTEISKGQAERAKF